MSAPIRAAEPVPAVGIDPERVLTLARDVLATEAAAIRALEGRLGSSIVDDEGRLIGALHLHDLFRAKVV